MAADMKLFSKLVRAHPWHGISIGPDAPETVTSYIEIVPSDTVKYELDKPAACSRSTVPSSSPTSTRPVRPGAQTYCGSRVAELCMKMSGRSDIVGDGDPLDICVLAEKSITHGDILLPAVPIGGLRMIDGDEADDKIIAVMRGDAIYGHMNELHECPPTMVTRLKHYFLTYKQDPGTRTRNTEITHVYGREEALEVIERSQADYLEKYGDIASTLADYQAEK